MLDKDSAMGNTPGESNIGQLLIIKERRRIKELTYKLKHEDILSYINSEAQRCLRLNHEKGQDHVLQNMSYSLNKQEF